MVGAQRKAGWRRSGAKTRYHATAPPHHHIRRWVENTDGTHRLASIAAPRPPATMAKVVPFQPARAVGFRDIPEPNEIFECPGCHVKVIVRSDYSCPSCQVDMRNVSDDGQRRITVSDGAVLPALCAHCGGEAEGYRPLAVSRTLDDGGLHWFWRGLAALIMHVPSGLKTRQSVTISVDVPFCGSCRECPPLRPEHVRFAEREVTLLVHERLRRAIDEQLGGL